MIEKYAKPIEYVNEKMDLKNTRDRHTHLIGIIKDYNFKTMLDVGERTLFTERLEREFNCKVDSTTGDLDEEVNAPGEQYDIIVFSHIIEHLFNPLFALLKLKEFMGKDSLMMIALPSRGKLLWTDTHFHEIDSQRMRTLLQRAGLKIIREEKLKSIRNFNFYLRGIRPLLRLLFEYNKVYVVQRV